ncbi:hypothetical protein [Brumicola blandensis]|uniref:Uncharacterized protein n=1 Tax=Brumicola blandensis TaxID=3075611 RepID=A0AAW8R0P8_9ALTE|nr:hypothetical protein [Alteromonas sp. W409]MDT0581827.1 hypothetical protein [Alteromonas sp. W409]
MKLTLLVVFVSLSFGVSAMDKTVKLIDDLILKKNFGIELWEPRGLNPSPPGVILSLEKTTNEFLKSLRHIHLKSDLTKDLKKSNIQTLVDNLPWLDFDTEEREFLADTIAPAIESMGFNPWSII